MNRQTIIVDLENAKQHKQKINDKIKKWIDEYNGEPYGNEIEGRSKIVWKLIKKHGEILIANLVKPFLTGSDVINLEPRTRYDIHKANIDNKLLNFFFNKEFDKVKFIKTLVRVMVKEGIAFAKVSWIQNKKENKPYAEVLYNEDIFTDPDASSLQESKFIIHRFRTTYEELESNPIYDKEAINSFKRLQEEDSDEFTDDLHNREIGSFKREENNETFLYEYWYKKKDKVYVISFINDDKNTEILSNEEYEYSWYPFIDFPFYDEEFNIWGRALADIISDEQKFMTSIVRGVIDNMAMSNNGIKFVKKGALDSINFKNLMEGKPVVEINATDDVSRVIRDGSFNELPASVYNLLQIIENQAEGLTGVSKYMQGLTDLQNSTATATQTIMTQSQIRLLDIENNVSRGLKNLFFMWIEMILDYITEEQVLQISGTTFAEEKAKMIEKLKREYNLEELDQETAQKAMMLIMQEVEKVFDKETTKYDIKIQIGTDGLKQIKINQINMLMQQSASLVQAGAVPPEIIQQLLAKLFELFDYPDLSEKVANFKQQPNPLQQQMMQLEMAEKQAKAQKEQALAQNALARTKATEARAQKELASIDADVANKYADVVNKLKGVDTDENNVTDGKRPDEQ